MRAQHRSLPLIILFVAALIVANGCSDSPTRVSRSQSSPPPPEPFIETVGSTAHDECHDIAVDPSGNVFVVGAFSAPVEFGGQTFDPAHGPVFLAKYDPTGEFQWVKHISGAAPDGPLRLGTDDSDNVILQGLFFTTLTIDRVAVTSNGGADHVFVARLNASGGVSWIAYDTAPYISVGLGMGTGRGGGTAVTGFIKVGATFGDSELMVQGFDFFLVYYDSKGNAHWAKQTGSSTVATGGEVAVDARGSVIATGNFVESFTLDGVELTADAGDSFIAKYNAAGELQWLKSLGNNTAENIYGVATDRDGDIYVAGRSATGTLWRLDPDGNEIWEASAATADDIAVDLEKNILLSGSYRGTLTVGDSEVVSNGLSDFFVARYDASGQGLWVTAGGGAREDRAQGLAVDQSGSPLTVVDFSESFEFGGETVTSRGEQDILITRLE